MPRGCEPGKIGVSRNSAGDDALFSKRCGAFVVHVLVPTTLLYGSQDGHNFREVQACRTSTKNTLIAMGIFVADRTV